MKRKYYTYLQLVDNIDELKKYDSFPNHQNIPNIISSIDKWASNNNMEFSFIYPAILEKYSIFVFKVIK